MYTGLMYLIYDTEKSNIPDIILRIYDYVAQNTHKESTHCYETYSNKKCVHNLNIE